MSITCCEDDITPDGKFDVTAPICICVQPFEFHTFAVSVNTNIVESSC